MKILLVTDCFGEAGLVARAAAELARGPVPSALAGCAASADRRLSKAGKGNLARHQEVADAEGREY